MKVLPIGSVIKTHNTKILIASHFSKEVEGKMKYFYLGLPYPKGYCGKENMLAIPFEEEVEVLFEGYQNERGQRYTEALGKVVDQAAISSAEYMKVMTLLMAEAIKTIE